MSKCKVVLLKRSAARKLAPKGNKADGVNFGLADNEDGSMTVWGLDAGGNQVDISSVATLSPAPTSSDPTFLSVDTPTGMTFMRHGLKPTLPGSPIIISITATWSDGSIGPLGLDVPNDVTGTAATGLSVTAGTPTVRP